MINYRARCLVLLQHLDTRISCVTAALIFTTSNFFRILGWDARTNQLRWPDPKFFCLPLFWLLSGTNTSSYSYKNDAPMKQQAWHYSCYCYQSTNETSSVVWLFWERIEGINTSKQINYFRDLYSFQRYFICYHLPC